MRSASRFHLNDPNADLAELRSRGTKEDAIARLRQYGTTILQLVIGLALQDTLGSVITRACRPSCLSWRSTGKRMPWCRPAPVSLCNMLPRVRR